MFPLSIESLEQAIRNFNISEITSANIRQIGSLSGAVEQLAGEPMVLLQIGNPGLPAAAIGVEAECEALRRGVANIYPNLHGIPELKDSASRFLKAFLDVDVAPRCIIPTVGSMQGGYTTMLLLSRRLKGKDTMVFINPGFPVQPTQCHIIGMRRESFDIRDYRGDRLEAKLRSIFESGRVTGILYSNPNNPTWINLTEQELEIIGRLATEYDVIVLEDLAYMGMDFRVDLSHPGKAPFVPTVARYTDNYIILASASKIFSYAGQRIAVVCMSEKVFDRSYEALADFYGMPVFGNAYIFGVLYAVSSGTSHSSQYALAAMFDAAAEGRLNFVGECREYARRASIVKKAFTDNGFHIVYSHDADGTPISDGFFFTVNYGDMDSATVQKELMRYGISTISLPSTGANHHGVRVCVSMVNTEDDFALLNKRLSQFNYDHQKQPATICECC